MLQELLALNNEAVQIQVSADYNFHSEESFKITYWTRVVTVLIGDVVDHPCALTVASLRAWWRATVSPRSSLPGLNKVFYVATSENPALITLSSFRDQYESIYTNVPPAVRPSRVVSSIKSVYSYFFPKPDDEEETRMLNDNEFIFSQSHFSKYVEYVMYQFQESDESVIVTELKILEFLKKNDSVASPFVKVSDRDLLLATVAVMVRRFGAVGFILGDGQRCLKLPSREGNTPPVTEAEKAILMYELALEKLALEEQILLDKWTATNEKIQTHLRAGRKQLALTSLRERKIFEKRIDDINNLRHKLDETANLTQTAILQQTVVTAISVGTAVAKATQPNFDHVAELMDAVAEMQEEIQHVNDMFIPQEDEDVMQEYLKMQADMDVPTMGAIDGAATTDGAVTMDATAGTAPALERLIDLIPTPPTAPIEIKAPQIIFES